MLQLIGLKKAGSGQLSNVEEYGKSISSALIAGRGFPKDGVLRTSKIYSMMLMD